MPLVCASRGVNCFTRITIATCLIELRSAWLFISLHSSTGAKPRWSHPAYWAFHLQSCFQFNSSIKSSRSAWISWPSWSSWLSISYLYPNDHDGHFDHHDHHQARKLFSDYKWNAWGDNISIVWQVSTQAPHLNLWFSFKWSFFRISSISQELTTSCPVLSFNCLKTYLWCLTARSCQKLVLQVSLIFHRRVTRRGLPTSQSGVL